MYRKIIAVVFIVLLFAGTMPSAASAGIEVSAQSAILINGRSGEVLYQKDAGRKMSMASTTKIMTALLTLESGDTSRVITATEQMVNVEGTSMGLLPGDKVTLDTLACGMLLQSGNDAANAAALSLAGSLPDFAEKMNARAAQIGMKDSSFVTPSGLDDENHYTTAADMAKLGAAAMRNTRFREIASSKSMAVEFGNPPIKRTLYNHNRLLREYEGAVGVKTGFTKKSGRCLVSAAERDGVLLIAVTLNAPSDWSDHKRMLDYGFSITQKVPLQTDVSGLRLHVVGGTEQELEVEACDACYGAADINQKVERVIVLPRFAYAPVKPGEKIGKILYKIGGQTVAECDIIAKNGCEIRSAEEKKEEKGFLEKLMLQLSRAF